MTPEEWRELELFTTPGLGFAMENPDRLLALLEKTMGEDEHPEDYHGPCQCRLCQSYADL